jgi:hypothetical protein
MSEIPKPSLPHGTVLGVASTGVIGYNSNYQQVVNTPEEPYDHISYVKDSRGKLHTSGHKWQCVEFARRWWISQLDVYLPGVPRACDIWTSLTKVKNLSSEKVSYVGLRKFTQGETTERPAVHDALIWVKTENQPVGHIAIVSEVTENSVRVAEQNVDNDILWKGGSFTREFPLICDPVSGAWTIQDDEDPLHGWVRVDKNDNEAPPEWIKPEKDQLEVTENSVRVAKQNVDNDILWKGGSFTREFPLICDPVSGAWTIQDDEDPLHGWVRVDKNDNEAPPEWIKPEKDQLEVNGIYNDETFYAVSAFVGSARPSDLTAEELAKWGPFLRRIADYGLGAFLNTRHDNYHTFVSTPWVGFGQSGGDTPIDRTPLVKKLQSFLNLYPEITGVGPDLVVTETGEMDYATTCALQNMLNKVHTADEFDSAVDHYCKKG